jgi:hypothetical protein
MRASRIMKLVAHVSSSSSSAAAPSSSASWMPAAWLVLPLASAARNAAVSRTAPGARALRAQGAEAAAALSRVEPALCKG